MINKLKLRQFYSCSPENIDAIVKEAFYLYLINHSIDFSKSALLNKYFDGFKSDEINSNLIKNIGINNFEDLENLVELLIPEKDRKLNGAFFTPSYIVDYIINEIDPQITDRILDPSCGCGAFLIGILKYFKVKYNITYKECLKRNVYGVDILHYNIERTKILITIFTLENNEIIEENNFNLLIKDSIRNDLSESFNLPSPNKFDVILGNPPYVKFQDLSEQNRKYLVKYFNTSKFGTFNLYYAFFELGYRLLKVNGKLGYITPNNYFTSLAGEVLREYFNKNKSVYKIVDFNHRKVFSSQTYTAITFLNKNKNDFILFDRLEEKDQPKSFLKAPLFSKVYYDELESKKWRLLKENEKKNIKSIESIGTPLGKLFDIRVGIATLKDELYFIDNRREEGKYFIKELDGKCYKIEKKITYPIHKISDFKNQEDVMNNNRCIIFPYKIKKDKAYVIPENEMITSFPFTWEYFNSIKKKLKKRNRSEKLLSPFYAYGRTQGLTRFGKKILTPTFSKKPRFLIIEDPKSLFCNGYGIFFKNGEQYDLINYSNIANESNMNVLQKILNSIIMHYYVSKTSVSIEGGYPCYQKNFIEKFSIPPLSKEDIDKLDGLTNEKDIDNFLMIKYDFSL